MKQLSRKKIQDMIDLNGANISSRRSSGGSGAGGGGGVSSAWVDEHYVSKDFFARLFTINGTTTEGGVTTDVVVEPNDLDTTITNIQAMVGLWTEEYLSALGQGSGGGGGGGALLTEPLASINEAGMGTPSGANKVIAWNGNTWTYMPYTTGSGTVTSVTMTVPTGFKVSNGDTQTINNSGTFALTFGGTITKNQVLASPAAANGTPAWRALVADDIPTLTAAKISDITLTNGTLTIGNNSITPITDATLKSDYSWWGGKLDATTKKREGNMSNVGNILSAENGTYNIGASDNRFSAVYACTGDFTKSSGDTYVKVSNNNGSIGIDVENSRGVYDFTSGSAGWLIGRNSYGNTFLLLGNVGIGTTSPKTKLEVNGGMLATKIYLYKPNAANDTGAVYLTYDSSNGGVHVVGSGLYTDTYVSALGAGSGGGGGSTTLTEPLASINEAGMGSPSGTNKVIVYTSSGWSYMPYTNGGSGSVTSVTMTVPTGFKVSNGDTQTINNSGTFALTFGGTITKNQVLASPASANGTPAWRALVADDIPTLTAAKISDITLTDGTLTIGNNSINLDSYLPLSAGSTKKLTGSLYLSSRGKGIFMPYIVSGSSVDIPLVYDNGENLWIGATQTTGTHHVGETYISAGTGEVYISRLIDGVRTNNKVLDVGNTYVNSGVGYINGTQITTLYDNITRKFWNQTYWQNGKPVSSDVTGELKGSGSITIENTGTTPSIFIAKNGTGVVRFAAYETNRGIWDGTGNAWLIGTGPASTNPHTFLMRGNVGIGTSSPSYKLHVNGYTKTSRLYLSDSVYLVYDSTNSGVHLVGAGLYADTYLSALGAGSGGGSGSGITMNDVWDALAATSPSASSQQINVSHLAQALSNYVTLNSRQTISGTKEFYNANIKSNFGAKFGGLRINFNTSEMPAEGEINRSSGSGVCIQYDNAYNVDLCHGGGSVKMQDTLSFSKSGTDHTMSAPAKLTVSAGQVYINAATFNGNVRYTGDSDIRLKDVINPVTASVEDIANVRIFDFRWKKDGENGKIHFGSAAQDWQPIFPHAVVADKEGFLSMDYGGIAVGAVKTVAQEVVLLKKRVTELEKQLKAS